MMSCPVCGNTNWVKVYKINQWDIVECDRCGFAKLKSLPKQGNRKDDYSKEKVIQRNIKKKSKSQNFSRVLKRFFNKLTKRNKLKIFYDRLSRYLPAGSNILDVGCGDGNFLKLAKNRFKCTGIEISQYLANLAKKNDTEVIIGDFVAIDFSDKKYDGITLISLLEHLDSPKDALNKCFSLLNKEGILLLKTVNYSCFNRWIRGEHWTGFRPPDHRVYFTPSNLKRLLERIGFSKVRISAWAFNDNMYCTAWK